MGEHQYATTNVAKNKSGERFDEKETRNDPMWNAEQMHRHLLWRKGDRLNNVPLDLSN